MNLDFFDRFSDPFLKTPEGKGFFLSGIILGMIANQQGSSLSDTPLFKQIGFGKMRTRDVRRLLARVPELSKAYRLRNPGRVAQLLGATGDFFLESGDKEMGVNGNFVFAVAFTNAWRYYKEIFSESTADTDLEQIATETQSTEEGNKNGF